ncbi:MAG: ATP synthase F(0) complex subunit B1, mitochondrial [Marteilia pararefringens]
MLRQISTSTARTITRNVESLRGLVKLEEIRPMANFKRYSSTKSSEVGNPFYTNPKMMRYDFENPKLFRRLESMRWFANIRLKVKDIRKAFQMYYGKNRDMKNFPPPMFLPDDSCPVRFNFLPLSLYNFIEKRTGSSGTFVLIFGSFIAMLSKEWLIMNGHFVRQFNLLPWLLIAVYVIPPIFSPIVLQMADVPTKYLHVETRKLSHEAYSMMKRQIDDQYSILKENEKCFDLRKYHIELQQELEHRRNINNLQQSAETALRYMAAVNSAKIEIYRDTLREYIINNIGSVINDKIHNEIVRTSLKSLNKISFNS